MKKLIVLFVAVVFVGFVNAGMIFSDDFEGDLGNWTLTESGVSQDTSVFYQGNKSLKVSAGQALTKTMADDVPGDPLGGTYSELWTEFRVNVAGASWYAALPMPTSTTDVPAYIASPGAGVAGQFRAAIRRKVDGAVSNDIMATYDLNAWHHIVIGMKINPAGSVLDGSYSYYYDNGSEWIALAEDVEADFWVAPAVDSFGRIRIWANSGTMYVDDLKVYDSNPIPEPATMLMLSLGGLLSLKKRG